MPGKLILTYLLLAATGLAAAAALLTGGPLPWQALLDDAWGRLAGHHQGWNALLDERIPRLIVLLSSGAALAVAGAVMQALLQNPLAAPSVLGLSSGSNLMAILLLASGWHALHPWMMPVATLAGALLILFIVLTLWRQLAGRLFSDLILIGIAVTTLLLALQSALLYALRDQWQLIQTITEWEAGSTYDRTWTHVHMQLPLTLVGLWLCWRYRREINIMSLGDEEALALGVDVDVVRWRLILAIAALTGGAAAALGNVPFFGLIMPHLVRRAAGAAHRYMIPLCIVSGGVALMAFDTALRQLQLHNLTIGNVSAICGGLFFIILLRRQRTCQA